MVILYCWLFWIQSLAQELWGFQSDVAAGTGYLFFQQKIIRVLLILFFFLLLKSNLPIMLFLHQSNSGSTVQLPEVFCYFSCQLSAEKRKEIRVWDLQRCVWKAGRGMWWNSVIARLLTAAPSFEQPLLAVIVILVSCSFAIRPSPASTWYPWELCSHLYVLLFSINLWAAGRASGTGCVY